MVGKTGVAVRKMRKKSHIIILLFFLMSTTIRFSYAAHTKVDESAKKIYDELSKIPQEKLKNIDKEKFSIYNTLKKMNYHKLNEYYKVVLPFGNGNPEPSEIFSRKEFVDNQKELNVKLKKEYDYIEFFMQPLYYVGKYTMGDQFAISRKNLNQKIKSNEGDFKLITDLRSIQLDFKLFQRHIKKIDSGRKFKQDDFIVKKDNDTVYVILGNNYKKLYLLGDQFDLFFHGKKMKFHIVGFFEKGDYIPFDGKRYCLDNYIVMPFYDALYSPIDEEEKIYQSIYYSQKNAGYIRATQHKNVEQLQEDISKLNIEYQLFLQLSDIPTTFYKF
ncbi:MAG: hypothetical protein Q4A78_09525 [Peptostreptococcaceae bacterium]|nr:hypothetical protein [Peptostreptococcaceae bacterium]